MANKKILIVENNPLMSDVLYITLELANYIVEKVENGLLAMERFETENYDLVITDNKMPGMSGLDVLKEVKRISPKTQVVVITGYATIEKARNAKRLGAFDFITKPFTPNEIESVIERALSGEKQEAKEKKPVAPLYRPDNKQVIYLKDVDALFGPSKAMRDVYNSVKQLALEKTPVLIFGGVGTGKNLVARAIHCFSPRNKKPLVKVHCAESKGFNMQNTISYIMEKYKSANKGNLLLDNIDELPMAYQSELFSAINKAKCPKGMDVRLIVTSGRDLGKEIESDRFNKDLFQQLKLYIYIYLPPLKEHKVDIPYLAYHFLRKYTHEYKKNIQEIDATVLESLKAQKWNGNIVELENLIEGFVLLCREKIISDKYLQYDRF